MKKEWLTPEGAFKAIALAEQTKMEESVLVEYKQAEIEAQEARFKEMEAKGESSSTELAALKESIQGLKELNYNELRVQMKSLNETVARLKKSGISQETPSFESAMKADWDKNAEAIKGAKERTKRTDFEMEIKASQTYGDIDSGSDFAQMRAGVYDAPVRRIAIRSLFGTIPVNTEFYKYVEQETVIRDGQIALKCAAVTSNTKETLKVRTIETRMVKDIMKFCTQFIADYKFMASRIRKLITQSVSLKVDRELLLSDGLGDNMHSIDSVSSEFSAANVACVLTAKVEKATMVDLILGMQTQVDVLGELNHYMTDTVLVNRCDWFTEVESRKNADGNYLDGRVSYVGGRPFIGGMRVITTPIVAQDTAYVFDSTKGEIVDRGLANVAISFENSDDWEKEIGSIKAYERINLLVANNNKNAFMKCSTVGAAIIAINK